MAKKWDFSLLPFGGEATEGSQSKSSISLNDEWTHNVFEILNSQCTTILVTMRSERTQRSILTPTFGIGSITLAANDVLEPSPITDHSDERFNWLQETIHGVFNETVVVAPVLLIGKSQPSE